MTLSERLTLGFYLWEQRGRGLFEYNNPVELEPTFIPFSHAQNIPQSQPKHIDDGRVRSLPQLAFDGIKSIFTSKEPEEPDDEPFEYETIGYNANPYTELTGLELILPTGNEIPYERLHQLLILLSSTRFPLSFEIISQSNKTRLQIVCDTSESEIIRSQLDTFLPEIIIRQSVVKPADLLDQGLYTQFLSCALAQEFMRPIQIYDNKNKIDPLTGLYAGLEQLREHEFGMLQVLFQGTVNSWSKSIINSVSDFEGGDFFVDDPMMLPLAKEKVSAPLFAVSVRLAVQAHDEQRSVKLIESLFNGLSNTKHNESNWLVPHIYNNTGFEQLVEDVSFRQSHISGMLLNSRELFNFVHLPYSHVSVSKLSRGVHKTKALSSEHTGSNYELGTNSHYNIEQIITLNVQERLRHIHVIGATGSGKSNLIKNLIVQDIQNGEGICVLDPHGDLIEDIIGHIPSSRLQDVIFIDPADIEYSIGLNLLSARTDIEKIVLESDLVSIFKRQSTSWGDQMTSVLSNAINAFTESSKGGSLLELRKFLVDPSFRKEHLETVTDDQVLHFWHKEFKLLRGNTVGSILTRLDTFLRPKVIRYMMMQEQGLNFDEIISEKKVLLVKLSQGLIGESNAHLLGTLFIAKLNQSAQARQQIQAKERTPFFLYIDEFQNFITESLTSILSGARKYGFGLVLAHQDIEQVNSKDREVTSSVLSNPYTRVCFRCGESDARKLEQGFAYFDADDIQKLPVGEAIVRIGSQDHDGNISVPLLDDADQNTFEANRKQIIDQSRIRYGVKVSGLVSEQKRNIDLEDESFEEETPKEQSPQAIEQETTEQTITPSEGIHTAREKFVERHDRQYENQQHQSLQMLVQKLAQQRGMKAVIEDPTPDGGRVDVGLTLDELRIAVEVSVTNTVHYEIQNIQKCLRNGFTRVIMVSDHIQHLRKIREMAANEFQKQDLKKIVFVQSEKVAQELDALLALSAPMPEVKKIGGYRIHVSGDTQGNRSKIEEAVKNTVRSSISKK